MRSVRAHPSGKYAVVGVGSECDYHPPDGSGSDKCGDNLNADGSAVLSSKPGVGSSRSSTVKEYYGTLVKIGLDHSAE